jgi:integrase
MSKKGSTTKTDYIEFAKVAATAQKLLKDEKTQLLGLYIITGANTGLRISDILNLTWEHHRKENREEKNIQDKCSSSGGSE